MLSSLGNKFLLIGVEDNNLWRIVLNSDFQVIEDSILYNGSSVTNMKSHKIGRGLALTWDDNGVLTYYLEDAALVNQLPQVNSATAFSIDANFQFWVRDLSVALELVQIDLLSGQEVARENLPADFALARSLQVNQGFVVATVRNVTQNNDLLIYSRSAQTLTTLSSSGNFGAFSLDLLGQDAEGNIYYSYYAFLGHSGFSSGLHIRAISNSNMEAWDKKLDSANVFDNQFNYQLKEDGLQVLFRTQSTAISSAPFKRTTTYHYVELNSLGKTNKKLYLQPVVEEVTVIIGIPSVEISETVTAGYHASQFGLDASGNLYLYGYFEGVEGESGYNFAGRLILLQRRHDCLCNPNKD